VNIPDTVGYTVPDEFAELFRYLRKNVRASMASGCRSTVTTIWAWLSRTA